MLAAVGAEVDAVAVEAVAGALLVRPSRRGRRSGSGPGVHAAGRCSAPPSGRSARTVITTTRGTAASSPIISSRSPAAMRPFVPSDMTTVWPSRPSARSRATCWSPCTNARDWTASTQNPAAARLGAAPNITESPSAYWSIGVARARVGRRRRRGDGRRRGDRRRRDGDRRGGGERGGRSDGRRRAHRSSSVVVLGRRSDRDRRGGEGVAGRAPALLLGGGDLVRPDLGRGQTGAGETGDGDRRGDRAGERPPDRERP